VEPLRGSTMVNVFPASTIAEPLRGSTMVNVFPASTIAEPLRGSTMVNVFPCVYNCGTPPGFNNG
jgi:hypothetical protein